MTQATEDLRPLLSMTLTTSEPIGATPAVLRGPLEAHHKTRVLRGDTPGNDQTDLTVIWVPVASRPLDWVGMYQPGAALRKDGQILMVLSGVAGHPTKRIDNLERALRERLCDLGVQGDEIPVVHDTRTRARKDGTPAGSAVVEALNRYAQPRRTGHDAPVLTTWCQRVAEPSPHEQRRQLPSGEWIVLPAGQELWKAKPLLGSIHEQDEILLHRPETCYQKRGVRHGRVLRAFGSGDEGAESKREIERFSEGHFTLELDPTFASVFGARLFDASVRFASHLDVRVTNAWHDGPRDLEDVPKLVQNVSIYLPHLGECIPCKAQVTCRSAQDVLVHLDVGVEVPIFPGPVHLVDHGGHVVIQTASA